MVASVACQENVCHEVKARGTPSDKRERKSQPESLADNEGFRQKRKEKKKKKKKRKKEKKGKRKRGRETRPPSRIDLNQ